MAQQATERCAPHLLSKDKRVHDSEVSPFGVHTLKFKHTHQIITQCVTPSTQSQSREAGYFKLEWGGGIKKNDGGVNSTMIHYKNLGKCHNGPLVQQ
jgi:hypothetical protein